VNNREAGTWRQRLRALLINGSLVCGSLLVAILALESLIRLFPGLLPFGHYSWGRYDPRLGMNVVGGPVIYNKVRFVRREPNADGFMDVDHQEEKPSGIVRVGFFGDSYVESIQVPLEQVFFRRIPSSVEGQRLETFGFGIGGWGTVHSLINYQLQAPRYDFDVVAYLFTENDLGGNSYLLHAQRLIPANRPYAKLSDHAPGFEIVYPPRPDAMPLWYRTAKLIKTRMLLAQFLYARIQLLHDLGPSVRTDDRITEMTEVAGEVPRARDLASTWPPVYAEHVQELGRRILGHWAELARRDGRHFFVFYIPRGESMLTGGYGPEDTWRPWLGQTCRELGIPLVDPSQAFAERLASGDKVYDDHWTPTGHEVVADLFTDYLSTVLRAD
jgi:hypothetical protein